MTLPVLLPEKLKKTKARTKQTNSNIIQGTELKIYMPNSVVFLRIISMKGIN